MTSEERQAAAKWETVLRKGKQIQQDYYELLPDWTIYEPNDFRYLKINIAFALFGPPREDNLIANSASDNLFESYAYREVQQELTKEIFEKIYAHGKGYESHDNICYSLVYIVIIPTKEAIINKELETLRARNYLSSDGNDNNEIFMGSVPLFKVKKRTKQGSASEYKICYIDTEARVYESWEDYLQSNRLPAYTMIVPMFGFYQCNPTLTMNENESTVWLEVVTSSACRNQFLNYIDIGSAALTAASIGIGIISLFTPVAPVVAGAGTAGLGFSTIWTMGRSSQNLIDRLMHDQSINLNNKEAIASWLGVAGAACTLGTASSVMFITEMASSGQQISNVTRLAHNVMVSSNIVINFAGLVYQGYNMYERYSTDSTIDYFDMVLFGTHILFFGGSIVNMQFADDLIRTTQGKIMDEYAKNIRSRNLRKKFNRVKRMAAANNGDLDGAHAEVVRYINNKKPAATNLQGAGGTINQAESAVGFQFGHTEVCGITLSDPMTFAGKLILRFASIYVSQRNDNNSYTIPAHLFNLAQQLLQNIQSSFDLHNIPDPSELGFTLHDIGSAANSTSILRSVFTIVTRLMTRSMDMRSHIVDAVYYVWMYARDQLTQWIDGQNQENFLIRVLEVILSQIDDVTPDLINSFQMYLNGVQLFMN